MMHARKVLAMMILLVVPLFLSGFTDLDSISEAKVVATVEPVKVNMLSYETVDAIWASSDLEMDNYASALSWVGNGMPDTPYIIEGYSIANDSACFNINDVTRAFEIRDCYLEGPGFGININNATQVGIFDTIFNSTLQAIQLRDIPSPHMENLLVLDCLELGIKTVDCKGSSIVECQFFNTGYSCIELWSSNQSLVSNSIMNNSLMGSGVYTVNSDDVTILNNHISFCEYNGIWMISSDSPTIEDNIIHHNWFYDDPGCGIHLDTCVSAVIAGNEIYENAMDGIYLVLCDWAYIIDNDIYANSDFGINIIGSLHGQILENNIHGNGWWPIDTYSGGLYIQIGADQLLIQDNDIWNNTPVGVYVTYANNVTIESNDIYLNEHHGVWAYGVGNNGDVFVIENSVYGHGAEPGDGGITFYGYPNCTIEMNEVYNNTGHGIKSHGPDNFIFSNEVYNTIGDGIIVEMTSDNLVLENWVHDNTGDGIFLYATYTDVIENIVHENDVGVHLYSCSWCNVYKNDIGWNIENAMQELGTDTNLWNYVFEDIGNHWSDYYPPTGEGIPKYDITNGTHYVAYDPYPDQSINLTTATPISYEILETENVLIFDAYAKNPHSYSVWIDDEFAYTETWDGGPVTLNVDGLSHGVHDVMLIVTHVSGNGKWSESNATVQDLTPPSAIEGPDGISTTFGETWSITYTSEDPSGVTWSVNNTIAFSISSTGVLTNATVLSVGEYAVEITASDTYGNSVIKIVIVSVSPVPPSGFPPMSILAVAGGGAVVLLVALAIGYKRKKG